MSLKHLLSPLCPHCAAETKGFSVTGTHANGQQFETRTYNCGYMLEFVPNFNSQKELKPCPKSEKEIEYQANFRAAVKGLSDFAAAQDWPSGFRQAFNSSFRWVTEVECYSKNSLS